MCYVNTGYPTSENTTKSPQMCPWCQSRVGLAVRSWDRESWSSPRLPTAGTGPNTSATGNTVLVKIFSGLRTGSPDPVLGCQQRGQALTNPQKGTQSKSRVTLGCGSSPRLPTAGRGPITSAIGNTALVRGYSGLRIRLRISIWGDPWHIGADPDPGIRTDPAPFFSDFKDARKKIFLDIFLYFTRRHIVFSLKFFLFFSKILC
jgi:hypothetical protein